MKKKLLTAALLIGLISCSEEQLVQDVSQNGDVKREAKSPGAGRFDALGYGYDITDEYLGRRATTSAVVDIDKFMKSSAINKQRVDSNLVEEQKSEWFYGSTALDYIKEVNNSTVSNNSGSNTSNLNLFSKVLGFTATLNIEKEFVSKYTYSSKYSFANYNKRIKIRSYYVNAEPDLLSSYLTDPFIEDVKTKTAAYIVENYGTHVLMDITIGARLTLKYRSSYTKETDYQKKRTMVKAGLNVTLAKLKLGTDNTIDNTTATTLDKENNERSYVLHTYGGRKSIDKSISFSPDQLTALDLTEWDNSIDRTNGIGLALVDINWKRAYPIYEFIKDPVKKAQVKAEVERYIASKQIEVLELKPMYRMFNRGINDTHYMFDWNHVRGSSDTYTGIDGYVLAKPGANTKPMYRMFNRGINDTHYLFDWNDVQRSSDTYTGIDGYVLKDPAEGTRAMYRMFNRGINDTHYLFDWNHVRGSSDTYTGIDGYVYNP